MQTETERIVIVDSEGNAYGDDQREIAENRSRSAQQAHALARGYVSPQELQQEAEFVEPVAVNKSPRALVPFTFTTNVPAKPEQLNANFANMGNIIAAFLAREKLYLKALDSLTDRCDQMVVALGLRHPPQGRVAKAAVDELHDEIAPKPSPRTVRPRKMKAPTA